MATVLLVDDDAAYRSSLRAFLEASYDLRVVGDTGDGREAVQLARRLRPDAVVVDLAMPGLGGLDTARAITETLPGTIVVVATGVGTREERSRADAVGVDAWVTKGDPLQIENTLRSLLRSVARGYGGGGRSHT
jgi:DNA-binding NarL/FixJ family response regulator